MPVVNNQVFQTVIVGPRWSYAPLLYATAAVCTKFVSMGAVRYQGGKLRILNTGHVQALAHEFHDKPG